MGRDHWLVSGADLSDDHVYRYHLCRGWVAAEKDAKQRMVFIMLNPSTANQAVDDPTIRRCMGFARREGCDWLDVVNLYAYRATDPEELLKAEDPIGPDNESVIKEVCRGPGILVAAWGAWWSNLPVNKQPERLPVESFFFGSRLLCLGQTKTGAPKHPLYVPADHPLEDWA